MSISILTRIERRSQRLARLAALNAPAIILADAADLVDDSVNQYLNLHGMDRAQRRAERTAERAEIDALIEPMTPQEEAQLAAQEQAYAVAERKAQAASGHSDDIWRNLDSSYRFDLVMAEYLEPPLPAPSVSEERA